MLTVAGAGFAIAAIAAALGFSLAIGALFAGLLFSRDPEAVRTESGFDAIRDFFMPFFFVGIGLSVELDSPQGSLMLGALLLLTGIAGKIAGTALPALLVTSSRGALLIGVSMIPRAEIALVVAYQGLAQGVLSETHHAAMVFMSVASCIIAPWLIAGLVPKP